MSFIVGLARNARLHAQFMARRLMEIDVEGRCGAGCDERAPATRANDRHGFRERTWETRAGMLEPQIPELLRFNPQHSQVTTSRCLLRPAVRPPALEVVEALMRKGKSAR